MLKEIILAQNPHWDMKSPQKIISRDDFIYKTMKIDWKTPHIEIITGVRRSGKSTIFQELIQLLSHFNILLINFDHPAFLKYSDHPENLDEILEIAESIYLQESFDYLFFDEIQNITYWEKWLKSLYDSQKYKKIFITGSNSQLLETEYISRLSGRYFAHINFPFSFTEFIDLKTENYLHQKKEIYLGEASRLKHKSTLIKFFDNYMQVGGFPEAIIYQEKSAEILKTYYDTIVIKDVVENFKIRDISTLKKLAYICLSNIGASISYNNLAQQFGIHHRTVSEYIHALESSYLFFLVKKFDYSTKKREANPKKIYAVDVGLANNISFAFSENKGKYLENIVFIELLRRKKEVYYHHDTYECDFIIFDNKKISQTIQVCYEINNEKVREREIRGLKEAMKKYSLTEGLILTYNQEETHKQDNETIIIKPVWKWLIDKY
jgi:hypothetical protein